MQAAVARAAARRVGPRGRAVGLDIIPSMLAVTAPDLLLVDLAMPRVDGWRLIRDMRANPDMRDLPIVVLSENVAISNVTSYEVQANIAKPICLMVMLDILGEVLDQRVRPADW
jgi:CheY-like chemotaxis protein